MQKKWIWLAAVLIPLICIFRVEPVNGQSPPFIDLSGDWAFSTDPGNSGETQGWAKPDFADGQWRRITVPATWESQGVTESYPGMPCPKLSDALTQKGVPNAYNGVAWYRRWFELPADWRGKGHWPRDLDLLIGGVDDQDRTYLNGREVGRTGEGAPHPSTLTRRYTIPSALLNPGKNLLAVRVYDGGGPGGIHQGPIVLMPRGALEQLAETARRETMEKRTLRERFASPPNDRRILKIVHNLPKDPKSHETFLLNLLCQGFGGIVCNVHFDDYLQSEENWASFTHGVRMARKLGMALWLYDEKGYPSGTAGNLTLQEPLAQGHPEWEAMGLLAVDMSVEKGAATVALPEGPVVYARACPVRDGRLDLKASVDLSKQIVDRTIRWEVPEPVAPDGTWRVLAFVQQPMYEGTHATFNLCEKRHYINLLLREPTARFIQLTHQAYADRLPDLSDLFEATFTDEPSLMSVFGREGGQYPPIPWSPDFAQEFTKLKGYDLVPLLPALVRDIGPETGKVRCDFWDAVGKRVAENFFGQIRDWCRAHGVPSGGHLLAEEDILNHCAYYGNFFACVRNLDAPSIDCLTSTPPTVAWHIAKMIGSIADIEGRPITMSETSDHVQQYRRPEDKRERTIVSPEEIIGTCNRLYVGGINTTTSYYRWQNISTAQLRAINEYVGRCGVMLTGGQHICDIAVYYPIESVWAHYAPSRQGVTSDPTARRIAKTFRDVSYCLFRARRDFDYVDAEALRDAKAADGALHVAKLSFRVLVLPDVDTIPLDVWKKVAEFHASGGVVIAVGAVPENSTAAFPCEETRRLSKEIFGETGDAQIISRANPHDGVGVYLSPDYARVLPTVLDRVIEPDLSVKDANSPLRYTHRRVEGVLPQGPLAQGKELYFVINDSPENVAEVVSTCAVGPTEIWDPTSGESRPYNQKEPLTLGPYGGTFIVADRCRKPERRRIASIADALEINAVPIGDVIGRPLAFAPGAPKHVSAAVTPVPAKAPGAESATAFRAESTINEGERDCWSFPRASLPTPVDLSKFAGLSFESHVPEGQKDCGAELLVILTEAGGIPYLAHTGRSLRMAGRQSSTVWFDAFHVLGNKPDPNGKLDLDKIEAIAIGWGGYYGKTGERIVYSISNIKLLSLEGL